MSLHQYIESTIAGVPLSYFVYSALGAFGRLHDGELPGMWFIEALTEAGRDVAAIRQTLYRMEQRDELTARKVGRAKLYRATSYAQAEIDAGTAKIFDPPRPRWDGNWTMVRLDLRAASQETSRERLVALLAVHGFAHLGGDLYVHPHDVGDALLGAISAAARPGVLVIRGPMLNPAVRPTLLEQWRIPDLARRYRRVLGRLDQLEQLVAGGVRDHEAFLLRFGLVFDHLGVAWDDPEFAADLLPADWPGTASRQRTAALYSQLLPGATRHARSVLDATLPSSITRS